MQATSKLNTLNKHTKFDNESALSKLMARAAHDIRSPIAVMEISLQMIEQQISQNDLVMFRMAIQRVRDITNNLLDRYYSEPVLNSVFIKHIVEQVIAHKRYEWHKKDCDLVLSSCSDVDFIRIKAEFSDISRMLSNLLNNAIEACQHSARIKVCVKRVGEFVELTITDNGAGIPPEKVKQYLEGESSKHIGAGLGLSSARQYMENMGGKLFLTSQLGVGTTIVLKFVV